ncbi:MAG: protein-L-isoaspartate(D-aspartate) O-methyltransferase [Planctomycetota bacterium]|nr:protein-L-isoaspartate(D-aspartate) O-methyltransferase [Planctomycetota bacterium]
MPGENPNPPPPPPSDASPGAAIARQVRARGVSDARVLAALERYDRARFLPPQERGRANEDAAVPIGLEQTISQPFMVAVMTVELALTGTERVLEIGTGSGYQTAILSELAAEVFTVERHALLSLRVRGVLDGLNRENIHYSIGDGTLGWPEHAPYDRILVTAAAPRLPTKLFAQLVEGGVMVVPIGDETSQSLTVVRKQRGAPISRSVLPCRFVKLIGDDGWPGPPAAD